MSVYQKLLSILLLFLTGMMTGALLLMYSGYFNSPENVEVRISEISRSMSPASNAGGSDFASYSTWFKEIAREVTPGVVYIETETRAGRPNVPDDGNHDFDDGFWQQFMPRQRVQSIGSGVIISSDGYILTNNHVIGRNNSSVRVGLSDKRYYDARIIGRDPSTDLAILKIDASDLKPVLVGNSDYLEVGDWVMAVGNPFRLKSTVTAGIVSALNRDVDIIRDRMRIETFIQTDAAINRGNSGGALVNSSGELIGINTAIATESGSYQGYGFAIPINMAFKIGLDLIEFGEVRRPYLGVQIASVEQQRANQLGLDRIEGVEILELAKNGSADLAGLRRNDIILEVNGYAVNEANALQERIALFRPADDVEVSVWRNGEVLKKNITLMGMQDEEIRSWALGAEVPPSSLWNDITQDDNTVIRKFDLGFALIEHPSPEESETIEIGVFAIDSDGPVANTELKKDDIVLEIDGNPVVSLDQFSAQFMQLYMAERRIALKVSRGGNVIEDIIIYP